MNTKNKLWSKVLAGFAVGGVLLSGLAIDSGGLGDSNSPLITDASAGVDGGGSGGGGGGNVGTFNGRWLKIPKAKLDNGSIGNIPSQYKKSAVCKNAEVYYGLVPNRVSDKNATSGAWGYSFNTVGQRSSVGYGGGEKLAKEIAKNTGWTYAKAVDFMFAKNFICMDNPNVLTATEWRYEVRSSSSSDSLNENAVHSYVTSVAPQAINVGTESKPNMKADPIGANNLNAQSAVQTTNYGKVWEEFRKASTASNAKTEDIVKKYKKKLADAKNKDKSLARNPVQLNEKNQAGLAEGGILNVTESNRTAKATASTKTTKYEVWRCGFEKYSKDGWKASSSHNCKKVTGSINPNKLPTDGFKKDTTAKWKNTTEKNEYKPVKSGQTSWARYATTASANNNTQKQTGFWQIISAHCNEQGIVDLRKALGSNLATLDSGDSSNQVSGLLRTKFYSQQPSVKPLGDSKASNSAQKATAMLSFYDKECPFDCTPNRNGAGASSANGAKSNVAQDNFSKTAKGLYGAKSQDGTNSNYVEAFRDNTERSIRPDVWYPVPGQKGVNYAGEAPKTTLVTRWSEGTPKLGEEFNIYKKNGDKKDSLFDTSKTAQLNQKNFDGAKSFKSSTASQFTGLVNEFIYQSTWASTSGKPQSLQVAWEYSPSVSSKVPTTIGFNAGGNNVRVENYKSRTTKVDGRCWGEFGTTSQKTRDTAKNELKNNTGTNAPTKFSASNGSETNSRNFVLNFVRGTGE